jgi:hypothetical protein
MVGSPRRINLAICVGLVVLFAGGLAFALPGPAAAAAAPNVRSNGPFPVTFRDSGLAAGRAWSVDVLASNGTPAGNFTTVAASYVLSLSSGSYTYTATAPTGWSFAGGAPGFAVARHRTVTVPFTIARGFGEVVFSAHHLDRGVSWSVTLNWTGNSSTGTPPDLNATESTTGGSLKFAVWNGAIYCYTIPPVPHYGPGTSTYGCFPGGEIRHISFRFYGPEYTLTFTEVGLSNVSNASWAVNFWGTTYNSNGSASITVPGIDRGTGYWFKVIAPTGYQASPSVVWNLKVKGPSTTVITFSPIPG